MLVYQTEGIPATNNATTTYYHSELQEPASLLNPVFQAC